MRRLRAVLSLGLLGLILRVTMEITSAEEDALRQAITFHASFDGKVDADFARGDGRLYTATSYKKREDAQTGLSHPDIGIAAGKGRFGDCLEFRKKNTKAVYYPAEKNVAYKTQNWDGTVSFWLSLDPEKDLEPGYCDPLQVTDADYNDAALWVDFTKDDRPRHFRLGVFGDLKVWNPQQLDPDKNPAFLRRLVVVKKPPFASGKWTHVVISHAGLNIKGKGGTAKLYLDGRLQGTTEAISEPFTWDVSRAAVRLGVNYVGFFDDLALFNRALNDQEVRALYQLKNGARSLHS